MPPYQEVRHARDSEPRRDPPRGHTHLRAYGISNRKPQERHRAEEGRAPEPYHAQNSGGAGGHTQLSFIGGSSQPSVLAAAATFGDFTPIQYLTERPSSEPFGMTTIIA